MPADLRICHSVTILRLVGSAGDGEHTVATDTWQRDGLPNSMLPDFTRVKTRINRNLGRWVRQQIPIEAPLLKGVATFRQHEGRTSTIVRENGSEDPTDYQTFTGESVMNRDEMKRFDGETFHQKLRELAIQIGEAQTQGLLKAAGEAADSVGNVVRTGGELTPDKFFEVYRTVEMDFDPQTLQPTPGFVWVMHPDVAASVVQKVREWEKNPAFKAKFEKIMAAKREEWRDREANRKLVD